VTSGKAPLIWASVFPPELRPTRYELRCGEEMIATGHLSREQPLEAGDRIAIASRAAVVRDVEPLMGEHEFRLVAQLTRERVPRLEQRPLRRKLSPKPVPKLSLAAFPFRDVLAGCLFERSPRSYRHLHKGGVPPEQGGALRYQIMQQK
jgi:hypothetical protein